MAELDEQMKDLNLERSYVPIGEDPKDYGYTPPPPKKQTPWGQFKKEAGEASDKYFDFSKNKLGIDAYRDPEFIKKHPLSAVIGRNISSIGGLALRGLGWTFETAPAALTYSTAYPVFKYMEDRHPKTYNKLFGQFGTPLQNAKQLSEETKGMVDWAIIHYGVTPKAVPSTQLQKTKKFNADIKQQNINYKTAVKEQDKWEMEAVLKPQPLYMKKYSNKEPIKFIKDTKLQAGGAPITKAKNQVESNYQLVKKPSDEAALHKIKTEVKGTRYLDLPQTSANLRSPLTAWQREASFDWLQTNAVGKINEHHNAYFSVLMGQDQSLFGKSLLKPNAIGNVYIGEHGKGFASTSLNVTGTNINFNLTGKTWDSISTQLKPYHKDYIPGIPINIEALPKHIKEKYHTNLIEVVNQKLNKTFYTRDLSNINASKDPLATISQIPYRLKNGKPSLSQMWQLQLEGEKNKFFTSVFFKNNEGKFVSGGTYASPEFISRKIISSKSKPPKEFKLGTKEARIDLAKDQKKMVGKKIDDLSFDEYAALIQAKAKEIPNEVIQSKIDDLWKVVQSRHGKRQPQDWRTSQKALMMDVQLNAGLRPSEMLNLKFSDINIVPREELIAGRRTGKTLGYKIELHVRQSKVGGKVKVVDWLPIKTQQKLKIYKQLNEIDNYRYVLKRKKTKAEIAANPKDKDLYKWDYTKTYPIRGPSSIFNKLLDKGLAKKASREYVFTKMTSKTPLSLQGFKNSLQKIFAETPYKNITPYSLRHSFATNEFFRLKSLGHSEKDAKNLVRSKLGQAEGSTQTDVYLHMTSEQMLQKWGKFIGQEETVLSQKRFKKEIEVQAKIEKKKKEDLEIEKINELTGGNWGKELVKRIKGYRSQRTAKKKKVKPEDFKPKTVISKESRFSLKSREERLTDVVEALRSLEESQTVLPRLNRPNFVHPTNPSITFMIKPGTKYVDPKGNTWQVTAEGTLKYTEVIGKDRAYFLVKNLKGPQRKAVFTKLVGKEIKTLPKKLR